MAYEIDYLAVGDGERSGDAIALRYGSLNGSADQQVVVVIDGGYKESGEELVRHINSYYGTNNVNLAINTHPDGDHASGLMVVLEKMNVGTLLMHKPWEHAAEIKSFFKSRTLTVSGLKAKIEKSLEHASDLEDLAVRKGIPILEPFEGLKFGELIHVLGPSKAFYESLLPHFRETPEPKHALGFLEPLRKAAEEAVQWIQDHVGIDLLNDDEDTTSPENNTSTVILFNLGGRKLLFTGDAGKTALLNAIAYATTHGISLNDLVFLDVPHHGSKRNLSSKVLKIIKAPTAFISAPKESKKHPAKRITNALIKNGSTVFVTRGMGLLHHYQGNGRVWGAAPQEPFHQYVEG